MYETFENLPKSKKEHIIQVCTEEFAKNGYVNTSTNTIVKRLGISKGVLFLYFKSKRNLFFYIVDYLTDSLSEVFFERYSSSEQMGFLDVMDQMGEFYKTMLIDKPYDMVFLMEAILNTPEEIRKEVESRHNLAHERMLQRVNMDTVRKDIDIHLVLDLIHIVSYHVGQIMLREYEGDMDYFRKNTDKYLDLFEQHMDIIKYGIVPR